MLLINAFPFIDKMIKTIHISGMHCPSCSMLITDVLKDKGVKANISHETGKAEIEFDESKISEKKIKQLIETEGYEVK
jgi:copper chaperone